MNKQTIILFIIGGILGIAALNILSKAVNQDLAQVVNLIGKSAWPGVFSIVFLGTGAASLKNS